MCNKLWQMNVIKNSFLQPDWDQPSSQGCILCSLRWYLRTNVVWCISGCTSTHSWPFPRTYSVFLFLAPWIFSPSAQWNDKTLCSHISELKSPLTKKLCLWEPRSNSEHLEAILEDCFPVYWSMNQRGGTCQGWMHWNHTAIDITFAPDPFRLSFNASQPSSPEEGKLLTSA